MLSGGSKPAAAQQGSTTYGGTATTDVLVGDGLTTTPRRYQKQVIVVFAPPKQGGLAETTPFDLFVGPANRNETGQPGHFEIHSAVLVGSNLFQFWELQAQDDSTFVGTLTDPHNAEALSVNLLNVETSLVPGRPTLGTLPLPKAMGAGTQLVGTVTDQSVELQLQGATIDEYTRFSSQLAANRLS